MDQNFEVEDSGSEGYCSPPKQKRRSGGNGPGERYNKTRHLIRWNPLLEERLIVAIDTVTKNSGIRIPYDEVAKLIDDRSSGGAIEQHIAKLRKKTHMSGTRIAPPPRISKRSQKDLPNEHLVKTKEASRAIPSVKAMLSMPESGDEQDDSDWEGAMHQSIARTSARSHPKYHSLPSVLTDYCKDRPDFPTCSLALENQGREEVSSRSDGGMSAMHPISPHDGQVSSVYQPHVATHSTATQHGFNGNYFGHGANSSHVQPIWYSNRIIGPLPDAVGMSNGYGRNRALPAPITTDLPNYHLRYPGNFHQYATSQMMGTNDTMRQGYHSGFQTPITGTTAATEYSDSNSYSTYPGSGSSFGTTHSWMPPHENGVSVAMTESPIKPKMEQAQPMNWTFPDLRDRDDAVAEDNNGTEATDIKHETDSRA